jgi:hypothetical protein
MVNRAIVVVFIAVALVGLVAWYLVYGAIFGRTEFAVQPSDLASSSPSSTSINASSTASSTGTSGTDQSKVLYTASFFSPYPVVWTGEESGSAQISLVGASLKYKSAAQDNESFTRDLVLTLKMIVDITEAGSVPMTLKRIVDESGASAPPDTLAFNFGNGSDYAAADAKSTQNIEFTVPASDLALGYLFETGGSTDKFFTLKVAGDSLAVELPPTE